MKFFRFCFSLSKIGLEPTQQTHSMFAQLNFASSLQGQRGREINKQRDKHKKGIHIKKEEKTKRNEKMKTQPNLTTWMEIYSTRMLENIKTIEENQNLDR